MRCGIAAPAFSCLGYVLQRLILNRVITAPVLVTLTLTFGLDLILNNAMIYYFKADYRKLTLRRRWARSRCSMSSCRSTVWSRPRLRWR